MFNRFGKRHVSSELQMRASDLLVASTSFIEGLESRRMLSASHHTSILSHGGRDGGGHNGGAVAEIAFSLAPSAVQTGLTSLAATDNLTAPTATTEVYLGNKNGVETYSIKESGTGTTSTLTVDTAGNAVTAPTRTTTTFGAVTNTAVTTEFSAIATALGLTAPASGDTVTVNTASNGAITYTLGLSGTTSSGKTRTTQYSVDANGNVVGNTRVPLSVLSTAIQNGLTSNAPTGATALTSSSLVNVQTVDGVTLYSATYTATGVRTTVLVNTAGALTSPSSHTSITFADLPTSVAAELQTLATADGVSTTIASTAVVTKTTEANGTVLYTIKLTATSASDSTVTYPITITVDAAGNPTVLAGGGGMGGPGMGRDGRC